MKNLRKGYLELIIVSLLWGIAYTAIKYSLTTMSYSYLAFLRFFIASIFFLPLIFLKYQKVTKYDLITIIILGFLGVFLYQILFLFGESGTSAGEASFIVTLAPLMIAFFSITLNKEKLNMYLLTGLIISLIGLIFLIGPQNMKSSLIFYPILIVFAAIVWSLYTVLGKKILSTYNPIFVVGLSSIFGTFMLYTITGSNAIFLLTKLSFYGLMSILFIGIIATFLGFLLWFDGLNFINASKAGVFLYISPFVTVVSAMILLSEPFTSSAIIGGILLLAGVYIASIKS
jgi:drug/metabolite transporter (DMT)-like permease